MSSPTLSRVIPVARPFLGAEEEKAVVEVLQKWLGQPRTSRSGVRAEVRRVRRRSLRGSRFFLHDSASSGAPGGWRKGRR